MFISRFQPINSEEDFVRETRCAFFILVLVMAVCVSAGCSFLPFSSSNNKEISKINAGFSSINSSPSHNTYSFDEVTGRLASLSLDSGNGTLTNATEINHVTYIRGSGLDETGAADSWMFAIRYGNRTSLVTYDSRGETISDGVSGFNGQEIFLDRIVSSAVLFNKNRDTIFRMQTEKSPGSMELELWGGNYTLTITGQDKTRILIFDAKTGALTLSND